MPYIQINTAGAIVGVFANAQPYATEWLADDNPAVVTFMAPPVPETLSRWQFFTVAAQNGIIVQSDALAAVRTGTLPKAFLDFIATLPTDQQFPAEMLLSGAQTFDRHHPFVEAFLEANNMTDAQADALWSQGAALVLS